MPVAVLEGEVGEVGDYFLEGEERPPDLGHHDAVVVVCEVVEGRKHILGDV